MTGHVVAVICDGDECRHGLEAMNNAGAMDSRMVVILNDNDMSIVPPVGAMSAYFMDFVRYDLSLFRRLLKDLSRHLPELARKKRQMEEYTRGFMTGGTLLEEMALFKQPIDGHNLDIYCCSGKRQENANGPVLVHVVTKKAMVIIQQFPDDKYHGVLKFNVVTGEQVKATPSAPSYTGVFAEALMDEAARDDKIVAITAAMPSGTGLDKFAQKYPERCYDVGIAEQHAVTFAAGLAIEGFKPFAAIYSTFLQRAYDQVVHDVAGKMPQACH